MNTAPEAFPVDMNFLESVVKEDKNIGTEYNTAR
jgi:hypothetical protein